MELVQDLAGWNRLANPYGGTPVQFVGVYATTTIANAGLMMQHGSGDIVVANVGQSTNGGSNPTTTGKQTAVDVAANAALTSNQVPGAGGLTAGTSATQATIIATANAALANNQTAQYGL